MKRDGRRSRASGGSGVIKACRRDRHICKAFGVESVGFEIVQNMRDEVFGQVPFQPSGADGERVLLGAEDGLDSERILQRISMMSARPLLGGRLTSGLGKCSLSDVNRLLVGL
jgi:hypothetical protein